MFHTTFKSQVFCNKAVQLLELPINENVVIVSMPMAEKCLLTFLFVLSNEF